MMRMTRGGMGMPRKARARTGAAMTVTEPAGRRGQERTQGTERRPRRMLEEVAGWTGRRTAGG